ncbi:hypothetical protein FISHEDRAFT_65441 [Fistulina hepatica ATCC 64428]|nr:hypothetical protein FISHEDRAFT_65441 [Fistulina hepatica ATCC 64428]
MVSAVSRGKQRARDTSPASSTPNETEPPKKRKRYQVETRPCPVCGDAVPVRRLAAHAALEAERVDQIVGEIGSTDVLLEGGSSTYARRSAVNARHSFRLSCTSTADPVDKIIHGIRKRRRQRHAALRELAKGDGVDTDDSWLRANEVVCPVCIQPVVGDPDVVAAHVDACIAFQSQQLDAANVNVDDAQSDRSTPGHVGDVTGTGFYTRDPRQTDADIDVDIDGDDEALFGASQFTEEDILAASGPLDVDVDGDAAESLRDLIAHAKISVRSFDDIASVTEDAVRLDTTIADARPNGDNVAPVAAPSLRGSSVSSASSSFLCRICLDPYNEPTVSTGCWHTCCRQCWLRCLGSTRLCPICKRITAASDLRRVYL